MRLSLRRPVCRELGKHHAAPPPAPEPAARTAELRVAAAALHLDAAHSVGVYLHLRELPELPPGPPVPRDGAPRWLPVSIAEDFDLSSRDVLVTYDPADPGAGVTYDPAGEHTWGCPVGSRRTPPVAAPRFASERVTDDACRH